MPTPRPLCFVVMPFGTKETGGGSGAPARVDFDRLWSLALQPLLTKLGYEVHRADLGQGVSIVREMIEQLAIADLVIADLSLPNPNVYYEVGVRHAARRDGCVLVAADWARHPFDTRGFRHVTYPLPDGDVPDAAAVAIQNALREPVARLRDALTPCFELDGFPNLDTKRALAFRKSLDAEREFETRLDAIRLKPGDERALEIAKILEETTGGRLSPRTAVRVLLLVRDHGGTATPGTLSAEGWSAVVKFVDALADDVRTLPLVVEQRALAVSNLGNHAEAIAALETLIRTRGDTPERRGLLGGRWKRLWRDAQRAPEASEERRRAPQHLYKAIDAYERGMFLDLNEYYCASNLSRLYRSRGREGDLERALRASQATVLACERMRAAGLADEWLKPSLLGAAFDAGDLAKVQQLADEIEAEGGAVWMREAMIADLEVSANLVDDEDRRAALQSVVAQLAALGT